MKRSTERILTTHAGSLPRPAGLLEMVTAKSRGQAVDEADLRQRLQHGIAEVVQQQMSSGIDIINDGELSKTSFTDYVRGRLGGLDPRPAAPYASTISGRDMQEFPEYFDPRTGFPHTRQAGSYTGRMQVACTGPLTYTGQAAVQADIANFKVYRRRRRTCRRLPPAPSSIG